MSEADQQKPDMRSQGALEALQAAAREAGGDASGPLPVDVWDPPYCGDIGLEILSDGTWLYRGSSIGRMALVTLFARVLRKDDDGKTYLVTPVEKIDIKVHDAPFLAVEMAVDGKGNKQNLSFRTNLNEIVTADKDHPLRFIVDPATGGLKPYVRVRGRLDALLTRAVYAELIDIASTATDASLDDLPMGVWSGGTFWQFPEPD